MVDTARTLAALQLLLADNVAGDISAQDIRDFLVSLAFSGARISDPAGADQDLTGGVEALVTFDTEDFDTDGYATLGTNNDRLTVPTAGKYLIVGNLETQGLVDGYSYLAIWKNGLAGTRLMRAKNDSSDGLQQPINAMYIDNAAASDYYSLGLLVEGNVQDIIHDTWMPTMSIVRLGFIGD